MVFIGQSRSPPAVTTTLARSTPLAPSQSLANIPEHGIKLYAMRLQSHPSPPVPVIHEGAQGEYWNHPQFLILTMHSLSDPIKSFWKLFGSATVY